MIHIYIATIFPEIFPGPLGISLLKKAMEKNIWCLYTIDLRIFHPKGRIDDKIFGGMPGMIIKPEIIEKLMEYKNIKWNKILYTNPTGELLNQKYLNSLLENIHIHEGDYNLLVITGRYEGIDARTIKYYNIEEFSLGEFVLCGGEIPAMALVEGLIRLIPGVLGNNLSLENESFTSNQNLQYEKYTRPRVWKNIPVPEVLYNGNHKLIDKWKKNK
jgi:tRNA (guanine37-N1)-methyltransferase